MSDTPSEDLEWVIDWLIQEKGLTRAQANEAFAEIGADKSTWEQYADGIYDAWERGERPEWKSVREAELERRQQIAFERDQIPDVGPAQFDGGEENPEGARVLEGFSALRNRFNTGFDGEIDDATRIEIENDAAALLRADESLGPDEARRRAEEAIQSQSSFVYTDLGKREQYRMLPGFTDDEVARLRVEDPKRYNEILQHARELGVFAELGLDRGTISATALGSVGPQILKRYAQTVNAQTRKNKWEYEQDLRQALSQFASGMSGMDEIVSNLGYEGESAAAFVDDMNGYQANEWKISMAPQDGAPGGMDEYEFLQARLPFDQMTITQAKAAFSSFTEDELAAVQSMMVQMGLYDNGPPTLGIMQMDVDDVAFTKLMRMIQVKQGVHPGKVINDAIEVRREKMLREQGYGVDGDLNGDGIADKILPVTSRATLGNIADAAVERVTGRRITDETFKNDLVNDAMKQEQKYLRALNGSFVNNRVQQGGGTVEDVDLFLRAISGQESGGDYNAVNQHSGASGKFQFMPDTWKQWSVASGLGHNAAMTPENQEHVARAMASSYFNDYGNWYDAAIAWYMGPGKVGDVVAQGANQPYHYPSGRKYGEDVLGRMSKIQREDLAAMQRTNDFGVTFGDDGLAFVESFSAEDYLDQMARARDRTGAQSWEYHQNGSAFIGMLGSTV